MLPRLSPQKAAFFCHTDYYNEKLRKERLIKLPLVHFRTLEEVKNPEWRKAKGMIDILTEEVRRTPDITQNMPRILKLESLVSFVIGG